MDTERHVIFYHGIYLQRKNRYGGHMRGYEESHPWLKFDVTLQELDANTWRLLGEVESKLEHLAGVPLPPEAAAFLHHVYLSKGVHATTQIEGNTLSEEEVGRRLNNDLPLPPSQQYLGQEVDNVLAACNLIGQGIAQGHDLSITADQILEFNRLVLKDLPPEDGVIPGKFREDSVLVGSVYRGAPARDVPYLVNRLCTWVDGLPAKYPPELECSVEILAAIVAHLYLAWIHPFGNGNGRTARLVEFQLLAKAGAPTPAAHLLSNHYSRTRSRYYQVLAESSRNTPFSPAGFIRYAVQGLVDGLREQIRFVQGQQMALIWQNLVHDNISGHYKGKRKSAGEPRQRLLMLALAPDEVVAIGEIPSLTPELAAVYAGTTRKTISRDVNTLVDLGLLMKSREGVMPNIDQVIGFLPARVDHPQREA